MHAQACTYALWRQRIRYNMISDVSNCVWEVKLDHHPGTFQNKTRVTSATGIIIIHAVPKHKCQTNSSFWGEFPHAAKLPIIFFCWVVVGRAGGYERRPIPTLQIKQMNLNRHESNIHPDLTCMVERLLKLMINHSWCVSWHISIITPREVTRTEIMCVNIAYFQH